MPTQPSRFRAVRQLAPVLAVAALSLGLVGPPEARAACAPPQLVLVRSGATVTPAPDVEQMPDDVVLTIGAGEPLTVVGTYLTTVCDDAVGSESTKVGCSGQEVDGPVVEAEDVVAPLQDTRLTLIQGEGTWELGTFGDIGPDLGAAVDVRIPDDIRPGRAQLLLSEGSAEPVTSTSLRIQ